MPVPGIPEKHRRSQPLIELDREVQSDADVVKAFHSKGKVGVTIGANALVAVVTAGLTWLTTHHESVPVDCASKSDLREVQQQVSEVKQGLANYVEKSSHDVDREHNDLELLKLKLDVVAQRLGGK
jgi:hypothetical protein